MGDHSYRIDRTFESLDGALFDLPGWEEPVEQALAVLESDPCPEALSYEHIQGHYHKILVRVNNDALTIRYRVFPAEERIEIIEIRKVGFGKKATLWLKEFLTYTPK